MAAKIVYPDVTSIGAGTAIALGKQHDLDKVGRVDRRNNARPQTVVIVEEPVGRGRFRSNVDGRVIVEPSRQPFVDSARVLIGEGCDPAATLVMRHRGSLTEALIAEVDAAANLVIREDRGAPEFVRYRHMPRKLGVGSSRIAQNDKSATLMALETNASPRSFHRASDGAP